MKQLKRSTINGKTSGNLELLKYIEIKFSKNIVHAVEFFNAAKRLRKKASKLDSFQVDFTNQK